MKNMKTTVQTNKLEKELTEPEQGLTVFQIFGSIFSSFYGVQSSKNRERDFQRGKAKQFIAAGIVVTFFWYFGIYLLVTTILHFN
ncbi:MAG: hypothetical protein ACI92E_002528 [Oceanicoccus sp.]|jgi:hypothetical protein